MKTWPDEYAHWQSVIQEAPEYSIPFATHVFIYKAREYLRQAAGDSNVFARSTTYTEADADNVGTLLMSTLADRGSIERSRVGAKRWLAEHPEDIAEITGNLTALVWAALTVHEVCDE